MSKPDIFEKLISIRPEVLKFALIMEAKLKENEHKDGWELCDYSYLTRRLHNELQELKRKIAKDAPETEIWREAADVANFAMMIANVYQCDEE